MIINKINGYKLKNYSISCRSSPTAAVRAHVEGYYISELCLMKKRMTIALGIRNKIAYYKTNSTDGRKETKENLNNDLSTT